MMKHLTSARAALLWCALLAGPVSGSQVGDGTDWAAEPHLPVVPRTPDEAARIAAVRAPPTDFTHAERFEAMSGGATTSTATADGKLLDADGRLLAHATTTCLIMPLK